MSNRLPGYIGYIYYMGDYMRKGGHAEMYNNKKGGGGRARVESSLNNRLIDRPAYTNAVLKEVYL